MYRSGNARDRVLADNATLRLDYENVVQPDALLRLEPNVRRAFSRHQQTTIWPGRRSWWWRSQPAASAYDLGVKRRVYARNGVQEYLAAQAYEQRVDWFVLREGVYEALQPGTDGIVRSEVFPGLWLPADALWAGDLAGMITVLQQGLASAEHAAFVAQLQERLAAASPSANP